MQVLINIPEDEYNIIKKSNAPMTWAEHLIANGTPLPKGHGDLIDRDEVEKLEERLCATECACCGLDGCFYNEADTIIEADRSEEK